MKKREKMNLKLATEYLADLIRESGAEAKVVPGLTPGGLGILVGKPKPVRKKHQG